MEKSRPLIQIIDRPGRPVAIRVFHYERSSNILNQFPDAVIRRAVNKGRTRDEDRLLKAARSLSRPGYRIVERHVIYQRALKIQAEIHARNLRSIRVRRFPQQQNFRLPPDRSEMGPTFTPRSVREQEFTLTQLYARDVGAEPIGSMREMPSRSRGR